MWRSNLSFAYDAIGLFIFCIGLVSTENIGCKNVLITNTERLWYIQSPNYKAYFTNETDVCWRVRVSDSGNHVISLSAVFFRLQPKDDDKCRGELEIRDGCKALSPLLGRYCHKFTPTISTTGCLYIRFKAEGDFVGDKGFQLQLQILATPKLGLLPSVDSNCIPLQVDSSLSLYYLSSPGYPHSYLSNVDKCYIIYLTDSIKNGKDMYYIRFKVLNSELEDSSYCEKDYVEVHDGASREDTELVRWCGGMIPYNTTSCGDKLHIRFVSDGTNEKIGFNAVFEAVLRKNTTCGYNNPNRMNNTMIVLVIVFLCVLIVCLCFCTIYCRKCLRNRDSDEYE